MSLVAFGLFKGTIMNPKIIKVMAISEDEIIKALGEENYSDKIVDAYAYTSNAGDYIFHKYILEDIAANSSECSFKDNLQKIIQKMTIKNCTSLMVTM